MSLVTAQAAIVTTLTPLFPEAKRVAAHGGRFTETDLLTLLGSLPVVLVACLGVQSIACRERDYWDVELRWAVYCLASGADRDTTALQMAYTLIDALPGQRWGLGEDGARLPEVASIQAANLYSGDVKGASATAKGVWQQIALWAVTWTQVFVLPKL